MTNMRFTWMPRWLKGSKRQGHLVTGRGEQDTWLKSCSSSESHDEETVTRIGWNSRDTALVDRQERQEGQPPETLVRRCGAPEGSRVVTGERGSGLIVWVD